ncbi:hypothetical protein GCM10010329_04850 [Streptomyces spiroverticillatus]|uniref:SMI1/KNR4 family protein n=1 Tax=Streptomyces finlayi TaxID=67296 RepID=A0A919C6Y2_9ACTN|nr:SMI1/KNR4 family protein [Streptomyces finlayi]GGZ87845.1 hypothetical protein GCM10010329_04850 [Streptomyces spiroverticillatus]GHC78988.1 hypothetical protein GCM10010334_04830 [Streptomyces finlayi]
MSTEPDFLQGVFHLLGDPPQRPEPAELWRETEAVVGCALPEDYKEIIGRYGPARVNGHLYFSTPDSGRWSLREEIPETIRAWADADWEPDEDEITGGDPRTLFGWDGLKFGVEDGLTPLASTDNGVTLFFVPGRPAAGLFVANGDGELLRYDMSFAEWLHRYLSGDDVTGYGGFFYPGPVELRSMPMSPTDREVVWYGSPRD